LTFYLCLDPTNAPSKPVPLTDISSEVLKKVLVYLEHHRNEPLPPPDIDDVKYSGRCGTQGVDEWDATFIQLEEQMVFEVILAANFLDIKPLLYAQIKTFSHYIKLMFLHVQGSRREESS
jgi:S-phase kinase-associated protein 1